MSLFLSSLTLFDSVLNFILVSVFQFLICIIEKVTTVLWRTRLKEEGVVSISAPRRCLWKKLQLWLDDPAFADRFNDRKFENVICEVAFVLQVISDTLVLLMFEVNFPTAVKIKNGFLFEDNAWWRNCDHKWSNIHHWRRRAFPQRRLPRHTRWFPTNYRKIVEH